jgi:hypothetical protein
MDYPLVKIATALTVPGTVVCRQDFLNSGVEPEPQEP